MRIADYDEIYPQCIICTGINSGRNSRLSGPGQQCLYCNSELKCGEQQCIWREDIS